MFWLKNWLCRIKKVKRDYLLMVLIPAITLFQVTIYIAVEDPDW